MSSRPIGNFPWWVAVLVPARDEQELLPRCLHSVLAASRNLPADVACEVIVAVDSSTDRTHRIATEILDGSGVVTSTRAGMVGSARALAADLALARYRGPLDRCWLANTDADTIVPERWLQHQLDLADQGVEAVAGTVRVDCFEEHEPHVAERFSATYRIHPDGSHPHVHGANFGVRADTYLLAGGWSDLATAEDHDLWRRIERTGGLRISTSDAPVVTSGRRTGRAPAGFAGALAAHNESTA